MRWLGLRVRIVIALVAVAVGACWALAVSTTEWAASEHQSQLEQRITASVQMDLEWVTDVLHQNPRATAQDFEFTRTPAANYLGFLGAEGVLVPLGADVAAVDPARAHTYFHAGDVDLVRTNPQCLQPGVRSWLTENQPGRLQLWTERCGDFVVGYGMVLVDEPADVHAWLLVQALPLGNDDPLWELREVLVGYSVIIVTAAVVVAALLAAMVAYPLTRARTMAEAVAAGDLSVRLPVRGRDPVARMSAAVNTMADRLTAQITELQHANDVQRRFVADVAHELRTPTSALLASAEALENPATRDEAATLAVPQLLRLAGLTEDLLEISRMDAGRAVVVPSRIDLVDLLAEVVDDAGGAEIAVAAPAVLEVTTDPARLRVVVRNLLANAVQHGAPPVDVSVDRAAADVVLSVRDAGPGVPAELRDRAFDRFVRGDEARHGSSSGLGLAIARENARLIGGSLSLLPDGRTFVLELPGVADQD